MRLALCLVASTFMACGFIDTEREVGELPEGYQLGPPAGAECTENDDCGTGQICFNNVCVGDGSLRFSLAFDTDSDFDLHVKTPTGREIYYFSRMHDGGYLDVDQCVRPCGDGTHVENVFFEQAPLPGEYQFWVVNFDGRAAGSYEIEVTDSSPFRGSLRSGAGQRSETFSIFR
jgi:hypothetical protein